jgi:hypothetical protein
MLKEATAEFEGIRKNVYAEADEVRRSLSLICVLLQPFKIAASQQTVLAG